MPPRLLYLSLVLALALGLTSPSAADEPPLLDTWGTVGTGPGEWVGPVRFAAYPGDFGISFSVLVVDRETGRVQHYDAGGNPLGEWTVAQNGLVDPVAVAWAAGWTHPDGEDRVLVLDAGADAVLVFDVDGNLLRSFAVPAFEDGDVAYDETDAQIHVLLTNRHVLETYDWSGNFVRRHGTLDVSGVAAGQFDSPLSLGSEPDFGALIVADTGNDRIQLLDGQAQSFDVFGSPGSAPGQFLDPRAVAFDCRGRVLVADTGNNRVQRILTNYDNLEGLGEIWFAPPGGGLFEVVDLGYPMGQVTIVGKQAAVGAQPKSGGGDLFLLDAGTGSMRRHQAVCCVSFGWELPATATSAGGALYITPAGTGPTLESAGATVTVEILDVCEEPLVGYPFQDIWLDDVGNGDIVLCQGGSVADGNTNANGSTTISGAIAGGGATDQGMQVYLAGLPLTGPPLDIRISSPDITGDLKVDLADVGPFGVDLHAQVVTLQSDFNQDGVVNLGDVGILGVHLGEECP